MSTEQSLTEHLLDQALIIGEQQGWEAVHLHQLADACGVTLLDVQRFYRQKDELVDAWLSRADRALLTETGPSSSSAVERLEQALLRWLSVLAVHKRLTRQMLAYKLEPGHLHLQLRLITRVSRTVQWWREVSRREQTGLAQTLDEIALSSIFLVTVSYFLFDDSAEFRRTRHLLQLKLMAHQAICEAGAPLQSALKP